MLTICIILIVLLALDLLFTLALRCRKGHPKWELLKKYRYAHRGFHDKPVIPENSLPAFRRAIEHGFGAELDVHLMKDESFDPFALIDVKKLRPEICRGQLSMNFEKDKAGLPWYKRFIAGNLLLNFLTVPDFIAYKFEDRKGYCLRACVRTWGAQEVSWTIRKKEDLLACEADGSIPIFERFDPDEP